MSDLDDFDKEKLIQSAFTEELPCSECGKRNPIWFAHHGAWNLAVGGDPTREAGGILCPTCFHRKWLEVTWREKYLN